MSVIKPDDLEHAKWAADKIHGCVAVCAQWSLLWRAQGNSGDQYLEAVCAWGLALSTVR